MSAVIEARSRCKRCGCLQLNHAGSGRKPCLVCSCKAFRERKQ